MADILAIDWGTSILGILDVETEIYVAYRDEHMRDGAQRVALCKGAVITFNGNHRDLPEIAKLLGVEILSLQAQHFDMLELTSLERWPPDPGTGPILGQDLTKTYVYFFGNEAAAPPPHLTDPYEVGNWQDCFRTARLWKRWKHTPPTSAEA